MVYSRVVVGVQECMCVKYSVGPQRMPVVVVSGRLSRIRFTRTWESL